MPCHYEVYRSTTANDISGSLDLLLDDLGDELGLGDDGIGQLHPILNYLKITELRDVELRSLCCHSPSFAF